jgi:acylphosphatase
MEEGTARIHVIVDGRVQGVGFRYFVLEKANLLQISGWVRNTEDGKVEVTAEGSREALGKLLKALSRGPNMAYVSELKEDWLVATGEFSRFIVMH